MRMWQYILQISKKIDRISVIDENNERDIYLKDISGILSTMKKYIQDFYDTQSKRTELKDKLVNAIYRNYGFKYYSSHIDSSYEKN